METKEWTLEDEFIFLFTLLYTGTWDDKRTPESWEAKEKSLRKIFQQVTASSIRPATLLSVAEIPEKQTEQLTLPKIAGQIKNMKIIIARDYDDLDEDEKLEDAEIKGYNRAIKEILAIFGANL